LRDKKQDFDAWSEFALVTIPAFLVCQVVAESTLNTIIQKSECRGSYSKLLAAVADWPSNEKYGKAELEVFVDAMMYEPAVWTRGST